MGQDAEVIKGMEPQGATTQGEISETTHTVYDNTDKLEQEPQAVEPEQAITDDPEDNTVNNEEETPATGEEEPPAAGE